MKIKRKVLYAAGAAAGLGVLYLLFRKSSPADPPSVPGTITSGSQSATIETNVLSPNFGLLVPLAN